MTNETYISMTASLPEITENQKKSVITRLRNAIEIMHIAIEEMESDIETTAIASENLKIANEIIIKEIRLLDNKV